MNDEVLNNDVVNDDDAVNFVVVVVVVVTGISRLLNKQRASHEQICFNNATYCITETDAADPTCYLTQQQPPDTGPKDPNSDPGKPGLWQRMLLLLLFT